MASTSTYELPSKEATLFRHLVQNYESKAYKKGLKAAEQILKKHPNHGNTQAMKALILNTIGRKDEAFELCKLALKNAMKSHIAWHVYGLLWRSVKNYEEAIKAYRFALRLDPDSQQIQRDLALLQVQMRDYAGFAATRNVILQARPNTRQNWTALAVALHLNGELSKAEDVLVKYEDTLKQPPPKTDLEHSEASLYKNTIIQEAGEYERALTHLESVYKTSMDRTAVMEMKAELLLKLGKKEEAEKAYRALLARNAEKRAYYQGLETALGLDRQKAEDQETLRELYQSYADKSTRIDAARRIPLDFLHGEPFRKHADVYLRRMFAKGVPSTFANVKQLYSDPAKRAVFQELVEGYSTEEPQANGGAEKPQVNGNADGSHKSNGDSKASVNWPLSVNYFLAQHYNYPISQDLTKASKYAEKAIELNPSKTDYTYHMTRARILKHSGDIAGAAKAMNAAREMDLKDRYINTKCAKYQLRANDHEAGVNTMGLFTRKEAVGGPLGDLLDMQCVWYVTEDGLAYFRQQNLALALKRFTSVHDIFEVWYEDQFDFHTFSLRKGMVRAYIDMVRWEDKLREHPFFSRAALAAVQIYIMLHDTPELTKGREAGQSETDRKKAAKKAKKEAERAEAEKKLKKAAAPTAKATDEGEEKKKEDADPLGLALLKVEKPLEEAMKFLGPLLELSPKNIDAQAAGFEVYIRKGTYLPALRCLLAINALDSTHPKVHELSARFKLAMDSLAAPLPEQTQTVIKELFTSNASLSFQGTSVAEANEAWLAKHKDSAAHVHAAVRVRRALKADAGASTKDLVATISLPSTTLDLAEKGLRVVEEVGAGKEEYLVAARGRWSQADVFSVAEGKTTA